MKLKDDRGKEKIPTASSQVCGQNRDIVRHTQSQNLCPPCLLSQEAFGGKSQGRSEPRKDTAGDPGSGEGEI